MVICWVNVYKSFLLPSDPIKGWTVGIVGKKVRNNSIDSNCSSEIVLISHRFKVLKQ